MMTNISPKAFKCYAHENHNAERTAERLCQNGEMEGAVLP